MPIIYLSPSTQENNSFVTGGTEEQYMNLLADKLVPYLDASGIRYVRNTPEMTAASSIAASNAGRYDLHLALHSNAAPPGRYGSARGSLVFYYPGSQEGERAATAIGEVRRVRAPSVFLELAFHDNTSDAVWIQNNLDAVARNLALSLTEYFGIPFFSTRQDRPAVVDLSWGVLNIRDRPNIDGTILAQAPDGARLTVFNQFDGWYLVEYDGVTGYVSGDFVTLA